jgi:DbpA RNA binding domain
MVVFDGCKVPGQLDVLEKRLANLLAEHDLDSQRDQIQKTLAKLNVDCLDYAAALLCLMQTPAATGIKAHDSNKEPVKNHYRFVRYRLDVGSQHHVVKEQIQAVLIEESGVDKKRIGRIDIRQTYTLVELPDGMPADIFQLLSEATIGERKLAIKRVKSNRRPARNN